MDAYSDLWVLIPIYNEKKSVVHDVIREVIAAGYHQICIVDDGSQDLFEKSSTFPNVIVVRHAINRGKGAALKTGIMKLRAMGARVVVTMDGDGQHNPQDIKKLLAQINAGYDVALGSRMDQKSDMPLYKRLANYCGNALTWVFFGLWVRDSQSGLRAYTANALEKIDVQTDGYAYDSEVVREIARHQLRYVQVPIAVRYTEYAMTKSTRQTVFGGLKIILHMLKIR